MNERLRNFDDGHNTIKININELFYFIVVILLMFTFVMIYNKLNAIEGKMDAIGKIITSPATSTTPTTEITTTSIPYVNYPIVKCKITNATLYYLSTCPHCHQQLTDGTYDSLVKSGVSINLIEVSSGNYSIQYVPDWVILGQNNYGYQTWQQLMQLFNCTS
jgi:hypothetical protein